MIDKFVGQIMKDIQNKYGLDAPAAMKARIVSATKLQETFQTECTITDMTTGEKRTCAIEQNILKYSVKILNSEGSEDPDYPVIPEIRSRMCFSVGDVVTVVFVGGELSAGFVG